VLFSKFTVQATKLSRRNQEFGQLQYLCWKIGRAPVIYVGVKSLCLILLICGAMIFGGCATDEDFNAAEAAKTQEKVPGEANPDAPEAQQQTNPGFRF
jgi:hypothetical protein